MGLAKISSTMRGCVQPDREWATAGSKCWCAKLTDADVRDIRSSEETGAALARKYGVSAVAIWKVRNRRSFRFVSDDAPHARKRETEEGVGS